MQTFKELKQAARQALKNQWSNAVMLTLTAMVVSIALYFLITAPFTDHTQSSVAQWVTTIILMPLDWGLLMVFLRIFRQQEGTDAKNLFEGYQHFLRICGTLLLRQVYIFLWLLLLLIPGIVKSFSYAMTPYILADYPELKYNGAIELSMKLMKGHKWRLFCLSLSFIGWGILAICTLGIGFLWFTPYYQVTMIAFYEDLKQENSTMLTDEQPIVE